MNKIIDFFRLYIDENTSNEILKKQFEPILEIDQYFNPKFKLKGFTSINEAFKWISKEVDDGCVDNFRLARIYTEHEMKEYAKLYDQGCCGFYDCIIIFRNSLAVLGCNYGH